MKMSGNWFEEYIYVRSDNINNKKLFVNIVIIDFDIFTVYEILDLRRYKELLNY